MKRFLLCLVLAAAPACMHAPPNLSAQGKIAYTADSVLVRVGELERTAIQANKTGGLSDGTTKIILQFSKDAAKIAKDTPNGWQASLTTLWATAKPRITTTNPVVLAAMSAIDIVLGAL